jgi:hypothetical protein
MSAFAAPLLGIGLGSSLIGGLLGSSGARSQAQAELAAQRENRDFTQREGVRGYGQTLLNMLGSQEAERYLRSNGYGEQAFGRPARAAGFTADQQAQLADLERQIAAEQGGVTRNNRGRANPKLDGLIRERDALLAVTGGDPGTQGLFNLEDFRGAGPGVMDQMQELARKYQGMGNNNLDQYDATTGQLLRGARSIEQSARGYGEGERKRVVNEADKALTSANRMAEAKLIGRGMGSGTLLTGAIGSNTKAITEAKNNALSSIGDKQIALQTGLQGQTLNTLAQRSAGRVPMVTDNLNRSLMLDQAPIDMKSQLFTGGIANFWNGKDTRFMSGVSPSGAGMSSFGNLLSTMGGQAGNYGMLGLMAQDPSFARMFGR